MSLVEHTRIYSVAPGYCHTLSVAWCKFKSLAVCERMFINCYRTFGKATAFSAAPPPWGVGTLWRRRSSFCRTSSCGTIGSNYVCYLLNQCVYTVTTRYRYTSQTVAQCTLPGQPNNQCLDQFLVVSNHSLFLLNSSLFIYHDVSRTKAPRRHGAPAIIT